jgi:hypothetical protein
MRQQRAQREEAVHTQNPTTPRGYPRLRGARPTATTYHELSALLSWNAASAQSFLRAGPEPALAGAVERLTGDPATGQTGNLSALEFYQCPTCSYSSCAVALAWARGRIGGTRCGAVPKGGSLTFFLSFLFLGRHVPMECPRGERLRARDAWDRANVAGAMDDGWVESGFGDVGSRCIVRGSHAARRVYFEHAACVGGRG